MFRRLPPLNALRAFEAAARHLSFTRAADELHVTQSAISHQVKALEAHLGMRLFERRNRALRLTEAGEGYLPAVTGALDTLDRATADLRARHGQGAVLTISLTPTFMTHWLIPHLRAWRAAHPELELRFSASERVVDLEREGIDAAVRHGRGHWPGMRVDPLFADRLVPVCAPALLEDGPPLRKPADLARHTLLHARTTPEWWRMWLRAVGSERAAAGASITFDTVTLALQAAAEGLGVTVAPRPLASGELEAGRLVVPFEIEIPADVGYYLVAPRRTAEQHRVRTFRKWILEEIARGGAAGERPLGAPDDGA
jgi:LysR family glycine cleavage system transcriptional activator